MDGGLDVSKISEFFERHSWKRLTTRRKSFIIATIIVLSSLAVYLGVSPVGMLVQSSVYKTFHGNGPRVVTVYDGKGDVIRRYSGNYAVETYNHHRSVINMDTKERIDIYGDITIIIDEGYGTKATNTKGDNGNG